MSRDTYPLKLPHSVKEGSAAAAVAEKIGVVETAAEFFKKRAGKAKEEGLMKLLRNAPEVAQETEDEVR